MAIQISNPEAAPALSYDGFFLEDLHLVQKRTIDNTETAKYDLVITYRMYAVDSEDKRHYTQKTAFIEINDYLQLAISKAMTGDADLLNSVKAIEIALANIIEDQLPELGSTEVV